jgi:hypothetical protein
MLKKHREVNFVIKDNIEKCLGYIKNEERSGLLVSEFLIRYFIK